MNRILAYGEILWDVLPDKVILGGAPFNFAYRVNFLGDRGQFVSSLGTDELGDSAFLQIQQLGMDTSLLQRISEYPTGTVDVSFDENCMPDYIINPNVAYDHIHFTNELLTAVAQVDCLAFGTLVQRAEKSKETFYQLLDAASNAVKFYDINLRKKCFTKETIFYSLEKANILKINDDEVLQLLKMVDVESETFPGFCEFIAQEFNLDYVLVTFGDKGAFAQSSLGDEVYVPGYKIKLVDSLGAGDAFSAAFIHKILGGESLQVACEFGNALGALVATTQGATAAISQQEITAFLHTNSERIYHPEFF